jgi:hypothetical protein
MGLLDGKATPSQSDSGLYRRNHATVLLRQGERTSLSRAGDSRGRAAAAPASLPTRVRGDLQEEIATRSSCRCRTIQRTCCKCGSSTARAKLSPCSRHQSGHSGRLECRDTGQRSVAGKLRRELCSRSRSRLVAVANRGWLVAQCDTDRDREQLHCRRRMVTQRSAHGNGDPRSTGLSWTMGHQGRIGRPARKHGWAKFPCNRLDRRS